MKYSISSSDMLKETTPALPVSTISIAVSTADRFRMELISLRLFPSHSGILGKAEITTASKVKVKVFEAKVHNNVLYHDLDRQLVINLNDERRKIEKYPGLKVGSLTEPTGNTGNWE